MSDYIKATSFSTKDTLSPGTPLKRVQGSELDIEFNAIATAVGTKADKASPNFTGTPTAPTAAYGTSTTQLATTAFVQAALNGMYPVGTLYTSTVSTNPSTFLGFGTWVAFGAGRMLIGFNAADASFDVAEETGGSKDAIVVAHSHTGYTDAQGNHTHTIPYGPAYQGADGSGGNDRINLSSSTTTSTAGNHAHNVTTYSAGSSGTNANLPPYIVVYFWKRTA